MGNTNIISINPAMKPIGAIRPENINRLILNASASTRANRKPGWFIDYIFGINSSVTLKWSSKLLLIRLAIASYFLVSGIFHCENFLDFSISSYMIIIGGMLFIGFMSRIVSLASFLFFSACVVLTYLGHPLLGHFPQGSVDPYLMIPAFISFIEMVIGPGKYSIDQLIRSALKKLTRKH